MEEEKSNLEVENERLNVSKQNNIAVPMTPICPNRCSKAAQKLTQSIEEEYQGLALSVE